MKKRMLTMVLFLLAGIFSLCFFFSSSAASSPSGLSINVAKASDSRIHVKASWNGNLKGYSYKLTCFNGCDTTMYTKGETSGTFIEKDFDVEEGLTQTLTLRVSSLGSDDAKTLKKTYRLIGPQTKKIRSVVKKSGCKKKNEYRRIKYAHDWIVKNYTYDDSFKDASYSFAGALKTKRAVCSGYSKTFLVFMKEFGIPAKYITNKGKSHSWCMVRLSKKWYHIDCTYDDPMGFEKITKKHPVYSYFLQSTKRLLKKSKDHGFKTSSYPKVTSVIYDNKGGLSGYREKVPGTDLTSDFTFYPWKNGKKIK